MVVSRESFPSALDPKTLRATALNTLPESGLFSGGRAFEGYLPYEQRAIRSLKRAQAIVKAYSKRKLAFRVFTTLRKILRPDCA